MDHIRNSCSHNTNSRHSQNKVNNTTNATSSGCTVDNYTQLVFLNDMHRTSDNYSSSSNTSNNRLVTTPNLGGSEDYNQGYNPLNLRSAVGTEVTYNQVGQEPDASSISRSIISGTSNHYIQEVYAKALGTQNIGCYKDNTDTTMSTGIKTFVTGAPITYHETYQQANHIWDNSRHNNISSQSYFQGNNKSNTTYSDNYIHCDNPKNGKE